jgi:hypothetical protein
MYMFEQSATVCFPQNASPACVRCIVVGVTRRECALLEQYGSRKEEKAIYVQSAEAVLAPDVCAVAVLSEDIAPFASSCLGCLAQEIEQRSSRFIVLVRRQAAPVVGSRNDGYVNSFVCGAGTFQRMLATSPRSFPNPFYLCFQALADILNSNWLGCDSVLVRQVPLQPSDSAATGSTRGWEKRIGVMIAHRGKTAHLEAALRHMQSVAAGSDLSLYVGLDTELDAALLKLVSEHEAAKFYQADPTPAGPYVIRQTLIDQSRDELIGIQDSDDLPTEDRFSRIFNELRSTGCDIVGCHELKVNEIAETVEAVRYPLNVNQSVESKPQASSLLHATIVCRRSSFEFAGGFSTNSIMALDTQFMFRALLCLQIRNIDAFLYIRRIHPDGLTSRNSLDGGPSRQELRRSWERDFEAIRSGKRSLDDSVLSVSSTNTRYRLSPVFAQVSEPSAVGAERELSN